MRTLPARFAQDASTSPRQRHAGHLTLLVSTLLLVGSTLLTNVANAVDVASQAPLTPLAPLAPFQIVSADLRPFAVENHPQAPGMLVEIVEAMAARTQQPQKVAFYPWARAMAMALNEPRCAILPLTRTPEREAKFQWLVKLYKQRFAFITLTAKGSLTSVEEAKKLKIVVLRGSPNVAQLKNRQFSTDQVVEESTVEKMLKDLDAGIVDAIYGGDVVNMETVRTTGRAKEEYQVGLTLEQGDVWLAGSSGFTQADIDALVDAYESLKKDGTYSRLLKKYGVSE